MKRTAIAFGWLVAASVAAADPAPAPFGQPVGAAVLAASRGGFTVPGGGALAIAVDIQRQTPTPPGAVVLQNGDDGRMLRTLTTIDIRSNALTRMNGLTLQTAVGAAVAHSLQR